MFILDDYNELLKPEFIPNDYMTIDEKINSIMRLTILLGIISALIFNDSRFILLTIIIIIIFIIVYNYNKDKFNINELFLDNKGLDVIDNKICKKPTDNNPFMNPNILDIKYEPDNEEFSACPIDNDETYQDINDKFYKKIYRNVNDIYDKDSMDMQFYTVPSTNIPNAQGIFADWLYNRGKSCKENNGLQCYNNLYTRLQ